MIEGVPLSHFLILSTLMFFIGVYGFLTRKNLITILMSTELILNAVNINFVAFNKYLYPGQLQGHFFHCSSSPSLRLKQPLRLPSSSTFTETSER